MSIVEIVKQSLQIARTHKSLWLFAFVVGLGSGGSGGGGRGGGAGPRGRKLQMNPCEPPPGRLDECLQGKAAPTGESRAGPKV